MIKISNEVDKKIKEIGDFGESYSDVIERVLDFYEEHIDEYDEDGDEDE